MSHAILANASAGGGFDLLALVQEASGPGLAVLMALGVASILVWVIWFAKWMQLDRLAKSQRRFERACNQTARGSDLLEIGHSMKAAPGATVLRALQARIGDGNLTRELLEATARRAITIEEQ